MQRDGEPMMDDLFPETNPPDLLDAARLRCGGHVYSADETIRVLTPHLTPDRLARLETVVAQRVRSVAIVVEGIANAGNMSAVMRTAEGLGFHSFHVVTGEERYKSSRRTTQGAEKWLDVYRWESPTSCANHLHERGYRLIAAHLDGGEPIDRIDLSGATALVFGNEREGVSDEMLSVCEGRMVIPMMGFTQSFNISVAAAIALYHVYRVRREAGLSGDLSTAEKRVLLADYCMRSVGAAEAILRRSTDLPETGP